MSEHPIPLEPRNDPFYQSFSNMRGRIFRQLLHFEELPSTNAYVIKRGSAGEREGLVVLADMQTAGVGRLSRYWHSPKGGLYFSVLLRPKTLKAQETPLISLTAGIAVAKVLQNALSLEPTLKWPNDVLLNERKVAGLLAEQQFIGNEPEYVVLGIGINANTPLSLFPSALQETATTLQEALGHPVELPRLFGYFIGQLEFWYIRLRDQGFQAIAPHWRRLCAHLNQPVIINIDDKQITGTTEDITPDGSLIIRTRSGRRTIWCGDVRHLRKEPK